MFLSEIPLWLVRNVPVAGEKLVKPTKVDFLVIGLKNIIDVLETVSGNSLPACKDLKAKMAHHVLLNQK